MKILLRLSRSSLILVCTFCPDLTVQKLGIIRILHEYEVLIENSVSRVTVWHHEAAPSDAKL